MKKFMLVAAYIMLLLVVLTTPVISTELRNIFITDPVSGNTATVNDSGQLHVVLMGMIDATNSTSTPLGGGGVFTGTSTDTLDFGIIQINIFSDVASATDGLSLQQSSDGTNWDHLDVFTISAGASKLYSIQTAAQFFRIVYTNGGAGQATFRLQTILKKTASLESSHRISDNLSSEDDASLHISVVKGQNPSGDYIDFSATAGGNFKMSLEELESGVSTNGNTQLKVTNFDSSGNEGTFIASKDSESIDAFGRWRVSEPFNTFDMQFNFDTQPLFFQVVVIGGGGVSHVPASSAVRLTAGGVTDTHGVKFQTYQYFRYQPGKSQLIVFTAILGAKIANVRKRIGQFDDENGLFFEQDGSNLKIVRRTKTSGSVVDNAVNQSSWNLDVLDGTGISGVTLDETKDNIFVIDYQWLGGGRIRFGFDFDGRITYAHEIKFANTEAVPFTVTGNLPIRAEIFNVGTAAGTTTFDFTCVAVMSEGGFNPLGIPVSVQSTGLRSVTTGNDPLPIISIRPKAQFNSIVNRAVTLPESYSIMSEDATVRFQIIRGGSLTGASWADVNTNSQVEVDVAATAITGGIVIDSGFITGAKDKKESGNVNEFLLSKLPLVNDYAGTTTDILSIVMHVFNSSNTSSDVGGGFKWKELR